MTFLVEQASGYELCPTRNVAHNGQYATEAYARKCCWLVSRVSQVCYELDSVLSRLYCTAGWKALYSSRITAPHTRKINNEPPHVALNAFFPSAYDTTDRVGYLT